MEQALTPVFRVSELNEYVSLVLSGDPNLADLRVSGEISGFIVDVADRIWNDSDDPLYAKRHEDKSQGMADSDMHKFEKQGRILKNGD